LFWALWKQARCWPRPPIVIFNFLPERVRTDPDVVQVLQTSRSLVFEYALVSDLFIGQVLVIWAIGLRWPGWANAVLFAEIWLSFYLLGLFQMMGASRKEATVTMLVGLVLGATLLLVVLRFGPLGRLSDSTKLLIMVFGLTVPWLFESAYPRVMERYKRPLIRRR
jgi:hypothetical protein